MKSILNIFFGVVFYAPFTIICTILYFEYGIGKSLIILFSIILLICGIGMEIIPAIAKIYLNKIDDALIDFKITTLK